MREDLATMKAERSVDKLVLRGRAFASVGDETRAEQYFSAAIDAGGNAAEILPELLRVCIASKRYRVAIEYASPWLERNPRDVKLRFVIASLRASVEATVTSIISAAEAARSLPSTMARNAPLASAVTDSDAVINSA